MIPSIVIDCPADIYHADPAFGSGSIKELIKSIGHLQWYLTHPKEETEAMLIGSILHSRIFQPSLYESNIKKSFCIRPEGLDLRSAEGKAWKSENDGKQILSYESGIALEGMYLSLMSHPEIPFLISGGEAEVSLFDTFNINGQEIKLKGRIDYLVKLGDNPQGYDYLLIDLKTTKNSIYPPDEFAKTLWNAGYHIQLAYYGFLLANLTGKIGIDYYLAIVNNEPPFGCMLYRLSFDSEAIRIAKAQILNALKSYAEWLTASAQNPIPVPIYPAGIYDIDLPKWIIKQNQSK
jgi:hypothetical protein